MDLAGIIADLRSEREKIDQAVLSWQRSDLAPEEAAQRLSEITRLGKPHTKIISDLRSEQEHIEQAVLCLERIDGLRAERAQAATG